MSRWAALARAWTPLSVRLEMWNLMGTLGLSFSAALCNQQKGEIQQEFRKNGLLLANHTSVLEFGVAVG